MLTFKAFLAETDALEDFRMQLFLQKQFDLTKEERQLVADWVDGEIADIEARPVWMKLYDHYSNLMPYDVAKAEAPDFSTEEWVYEMVLHDLADANIDTHFKSTKKHRPRDVSDPMPQRDDDRDDYGIRGVYETLDELDELGYALKVAKELEIPRRDASLLVRWAHEDPDTSDLFFEMSNESGQKVFDTFLKDHDQGMPVRMRRVAHRVRQHFNIPLDMGSGFADL